MAVVYFVYRSIKEKANLKVRLQLNDKNKQFEASTQIHTSKTYWNIDRKKKRNLSASLKNENIEINKKLDSLQSFILKKYEKELPQPTEKNWLKNTVAKYYTPTEENKKQSELITDAIQYIIDNADTRKNSKGSLGLSKSRINSYISLKNILIEYQKNERFLIKDVNIKFAKDFLKYLLQTKGYQISYATKKIADLKTVCFDAETNGIPVHFQLKKIDSTKPTNNNIIYLNEAELKQIEKTELPTEALNNAKKWLLLGCNIGQRGSDLLNINESNFVNRNGLDVIELKQKKTDKFVTIPVLETTKAILETGLPYKISIQKFNKQIKEVCRIAKIDNVIKGSIIKVIENEKGKKENRKIEGNYKKWKLIGSHVCRRSFASNLYGTLPTPLIMSITAHSTEKMLLNYIGKQGLDYAQQIADFYTLQAQKQQKESNLTVVKRASNEN
ncbi:phage integrase SAM-like domain-containing protein [Oceanihabitans sediminis]|uniref:Integrase n=1 Tax=Oceanihabitans sediminis TaxID=1812012 RepID=A0A368P650_9FLAO|nr:phage integrase SAM-like domain-containing protein [Oceanihabitans sediminis]MDX1278386.1 phage integrase SAM-like domain-containing protein [Oceanihabitans sediminis]RBP34315.1 hypothetical protein DFR65_101203 [Oceanihabitans sediminis]RCU57998.1 integrase [Oceanihabitans sediminis]